MTRKIIVLLGLPGSGKGTQAAILANELKLPHISTGDIFRKMAKADSPESNLLNEYMQAGKLVPSDLVNQVVTKFLLGDECKIGCVLDGYPRNLPQAEFLIEHIDAKISAVFFDVENEIVVKRILGRYSCASCGALYNKYFDNPKTDGTCDVCGGHEFTSRSDDDESTIMLRIEEYKKETMPLIEYYRSKGKFFTVNAGANKEEVIKEVSLIAKKI
jgi:adenylate kinase